MSQGIYEDVIDSIRRDLDEHAAGLTEEVDRVIEEWETKVIMMTSVKQIHRLK